jgi:hypothetical protein
MLSVDPMFIASLVATALIHSGSQDLGSFVAKNAEFGISPGNDAACWIDLDNDGWADLVTGGVAWKSNVGKGFTRLAEVGGSCVAADFDNDGFADLFCFSSAKLLRNEGGKRFSGFPLPTMPPTVSRGACWGDFDRDGFVDLFVGGYENWQDQITYPSFVLRNLKGKAFEVVWTEARHRTRGVTACDFDQDGDLDVYASNYRLQPNQLWLNDGSGRFRDAAKELGVVATSGAFAGGHSIGAAWGDFDADGEFDLFAGNFAHVDSRGDQPKSRFYRNKGSAAGFAFEDLGTCGVFYQESYASPAVGDFDNDGRLDLYFTTVYPIASFKKPNHPVLFRNRGVFDFLDVSARAGLDKLGATYQAAWSDFDRDGDLDLMTDGKLFVNQGAPGSWIEVRLTGDGKDVNRTAIGAQVRIRFGKTTLARQVEAGTGEGNQNDPVLHFGLGSQKEPVTLTVRWPNGKTQTVRNVKPGQVVPVRYESTR